MLNVVMSDYFQSARKTKHSKRKESPEADPRTHVEPTNRFPSTADRWCGCSESLYQLWWVHRPHTVGEKMRRLGRTIL